MSSMAAAENRNEIAWVRMAKGAVIQSIRMPVRPGGCVPHVERG
jgi:hypothetical protein